MLNMLNISCCYYYKLLNAIIIFLFRHTSTYSILTYMSNVMSKVVPIWPWHILDAIPTLK